jgi:hypothetical protein
VQDQHSPIDDDAEGDLGPEYWAHFCDDIKDIEWGEGPHLITVDVLRAAGALDVPASWRKSLGGGANRQLDLFAGLGEEDDKDDEAGDSEPGDEPA